MSRTCEGAATIGLELLEGESRFDTLVIALGGGALASGIGYVARSLAPHVEVVAVQPEGAPAMALSWRCGSVVHTDTIDTIADGVAGRFPIPEVLDDLLVVVDDVVLVGEDSIKAGMRLLYRHAGVVVEPSAALGVAAILENRERFAGRRVATVVCGSNVATERLRTLGAEPRSILKRCTLRHLATSGLTRRWHDRAHGPPRRFPNRRSCSIATARFAVGEHPIVGKKLVRKSLESMTLNLRATLLEGET